MIMLEYVLGKMLLELSFVYLGDVCNNMGNLLMVGVVKMGMDICLIVLKFFWFDVVLVV